MKGIRHNIKFLLWTFILLFTTLLGYFSYSMAINGNRWFISPYNTRLQSQKANVVEGGIYDRNQTILAESSQPGERHYSTDRTLRLATSHVVGDTKGIAATGIETFHAKWLLGFSDSILERIYQVIALQQRVGTGVVATIDANLCKTAYQQLGSRRGAVVVMNYKTGEILCSVSTPAYDPSDLSDYEDGKGEDTALVNRVTMGQYAPGSVFKTITLAAVIKYAPELLEKTYLCEGTLPIEQGEIVCANGKKHGEITVEEAYNQSCNCVFAQLALELGREKLQETAEEFGFNQDFLFADLVAYASNYQALPSDLEFAWSAAGQSTVTATPLMMCMVAASVGNDGLMMEPKLVHSTVNSRGYLTERLSPNSIARVMSAQQAEVLGTYMQSTVEDGTASGARISGYTVCGKTGSSEVSEDGSVKTHAWFIGYIDSEESPLAITVIVENGGTGGGVAAPLARKVLQKAIDLGY